MMTRQRVTTDDDSCGDGDDDDDDARAREGERAKRERRLAETSRARERERDARDEKRDDVVGARVITPMTTTMMIRARERTVRSSEPRDG